MDIKTALSKCKTDKQAIKAIHDAGYAIIRDDTAEMGCFSVWLDELTRVYKNPRKDYIFQKWQRVKLKYSGIPTFFSTGLKGF